MKLAWRMFWREWRGGELDLLLSALVLGVTIVTGISLFAERLQGALVGEASVYLGADRALQTTGIVDGNWLEQATTLGLQTARTAVFPTMAYAGENMVLSSLKAVSAGYPLRGNLDIRTAGGIQETVSHGPAGDAAWVDDSVLTKLDIQLGDFVDIGEKRFRVEAVLTREGDAGSSFYGMGTRVMISDSALEATQLLLPGSRVEYRYLFAGDQTGLSQFFDWLTPRLQAGQRVITLEENQPGIAGALEKAGIFLRLSGALGVLLSALAGAFAAQRYCDHHVDVVAAMKTLGAGRQRIMSLLLLQLGLLWGFATVAGFGCGWILQTAFLHMMADWVPDNLPAAGWHPFGLGAATSLVCMLAFVFPSFWRLQAIPPWQVLRGNKMHFSLHWQGLLWVITGIAVLLLLYSNSLKLVAYLLAGLMLLVLLVVVLAWVLMRCSRSVSMQAGSVFKLGFSNVQRRGAYSLLQMVVFAIGFMLLSIMVLLRTSLLEEWQMQLPDNAPNTFLINIAENQVTALQQSLQAVGIATENMYPMVKGRLVRINGIEATSLFDESVNEVYRELNLSWSHTLPPDNDIVAGMWFASTEHKQRKVSIEQSLAKRLNVRVGDALSFSIGSTTLDVTIASIRHLDWDKMRPNFYFLFPVGLLEDFSATYITSFYVAPIQQPSLAKALRQFPSVAAYPVDDLIQRIRSIVERASFAVEIIMLLVLVAGVLVLLTCLRASLDQRLHESALLRTLGATRRLVLGSLAVEFLFLGLVAGVLAAAGAELSVWALQTQVFKMAFVAHPVMWIVVPVSAATLMAAVGTAFCYRAVSVPPVVVLRESNV